MAVARRAKEDEVARRLMSVPGVGSWIATAAAALTPPAETFNRGRDFAVRLGLTLLQHSTAGKQRLGASSKMGDRTPLRPLIIGASSVVRWAARKGTPAGLWLASIFRAQANDAGSCRVGEQNGSRYVGLDGQRRDLPRSGRGGVNALAIVGLSGA